MKRLIAVAALALGASGCFWNEGGAVSATWAITIGGQAAACEDVDGDTVEILTVRRSNGATYHDYYDCFDYGGTTADVRPGLYDVTVRIYDRDGHQLNDDVTVELRVFSGDVSYAGDFEFAFEGDGDPVVGEGRFAATWVTTRNGTEVSCDNVGAKTVELAVSKNGQGGFQKTFTYDCSAGGATTENLPAGNYVVMLRLLAANGGMLNSVPVGSTVPLAVNETKSLGDFDFAFSYRDVRFRAHMGSAQVSGGNCAATNPGNGAGVVQQEIRITSPTLSQCLLFDVDGVLDGSGEPKTTPTCQPYLCQEDTTQHTLRGLQNGTYYIQVLGYKGATGADKALCYVSSNVPFTMNGADIDLGTLLAPFNDSMDPQHLCNATKPTDG